MGNLLYPYIYCLLFVAFFIYVMSKRRKSLIATSMTLLYVITSALSIYYYVNSEYVYDNLTLVPYLYLFACIAISIYPYLDESRITDTELQTSPALNNLMTILGWGLGILGVLWMLGLFKVLYSVGIAQMDFGVTYEEKIDFTGNYMNFWGHAAKMIVFHCNDILLLCLFYHLVFSRRNKWLLGVLIVGSLTPILDAFINAQRFIIILQIFRILIFYLLFRKSLSAKFVKLFKRGLILVLSLSVIALYIISQGRYDNEELEVDLTVWLSLYPGEGPIRFNLMTWDMDVFTEGDNTLTLAKDLLGLDTAVSFDERTFKWGYEHHLEYARYYTYVGDFFFDFGRYGTLLFIALISLLVRLIIRNFSGKIGSLLMLALLMKIVFFGFTYNPYVLYSSQLDLLIAVLFALFLNCLYPSKKWARYRSIS